MKEQRKLEIESRLVNYGTVTDELYTNQEVVDKLVDLQEAMSNEVFAINHAEHFASRDIMLHFEALAREYELKDSEEYRRLAMNMKSLGCTIGSLKKGFAGERRTREALRIMSFDQNVKILYNITLCDEESRTEYDAIVITPYGVFVVEAKNFRGAAYITEKGMLQRQDDAIANYNLGEKMNNKEFLLRSCLDDLASIPYQGLLLYVDESAEIIDDYKQIPIVYCNTLVQTIRSYNRSEILITPEQCKEIENRIRAHHVDARYACKVECGQIIADFATLMSEIEERADTVNQNADYEEKQPVRTAPVYAEYRQQKAPHPKRRIWPTVACGVASLAVGIAIGRKL